MGRPQIGVIKGLLVAYGITGAALALLAFFVYQWDMKESVIDMLIVAIYIVVTCIGGYITGKMGGKRRFLWGFLHGVLYIGILSGIAFFLGQTLHVPSLMKLTTILLCIGGGTVGGMFSQ